MVKLRLKTGIVADAEGEGRTQQESLTDVNAE